MSEEKKEKFTLGDDPKVKNELLKFKNAASVPVQSATDQPQPSSQSQESQKNPVAVVTVPVKVKLIKKQKEKETLPAPAPAPLTPSANNQVLEKNTDFEKELKQLEAKAKEKIKELPQLLMQKEKLEEALRQAENSSAKWLKEGQNLISKIQNELKKCRAEIEKFDEAIVEFYEIMNKIKKVQAQAEKLDLEMLKKGINDIIDNLSKFKFQRIKILEKDENIPNKIYWENKIYAPVKVTKGNNALFLEIIKIIEIYKKRARTEKKDIVNEIMRAKAITSEQLKKISTQGLVGLFSFFLYNKERKSRNWVLLEVTAEKEIVIKNITISKLKWLVGTKVTFTEAERGWIRKDCYNYKNYNNKMFMLKLLNIAAPPRPPFKQKRK